MTLLDRIHNVKAHFRTAVTDTASAVVRHIPHHSRRVAAGTSFDGLPGDKKPASGADFVAPRDILASHRQDIQNELDVLRRQPVAGPVTPGQGAASAYVAASGAVGTADPIARMRPEWLVQEALDRASELHTPHTIQSLAMVNEAMTEARSRLKLPANVKRANGQTDPAARHKALASAHINRDVPSLSLQAALCEYSGTGVCIDFARVVACKLAGQLDEHQSLYIVADKQCDHVYTVLQDRLKRSGLIVGDAWTTEYAQRGRDNSFLEKALPQITVDPVSGRLLATGPDVHLFAEIHGSTEGKKVHDEYRAYLDRGLPKALRKEFHQELKHVTHHDPQFLHEYAAPVHAVPPWIEHELQSALTRQTPQAQQAVDMATQVSMVYALRQMKHSIAVATNHVNDATYDDMPPAAADLARFLGSRA